MTKWLGSKDAWYVDNFCQNTTAVIHDKYMRKLPFMRGKMTGESNTTEYYDWVDPTSTFLSPWTLSRSITDKTIVVIYDAKDNIAGLQNWISATTGFQPTGQQATFYVNVSRSNIIWFHLFIIYSCRFATGSRVKCSSSRRSTLRIQPSFAWAVAQTALLLALIYTSRYVHSFLSSQFLPCCTWKGISR